MKLSVIIPVHNAQEYLPQCLDSILNQELSDLEIICVDDASTDDSVQIIKEYQNKDSRVQLLINEKNSYAGACRNRGLEIARGEYVHFVDADDIVEEHAYKAYIQQADTFGPDVIKGTASNFDNETGEMSTTPLLSLNKVPEEDFDRVITFHERPEIFSKISVVPWNGIYRREFLIDKNIRFNSLICVNDRSFYNEVIIRADKILLVKYPIIRYRVNNNQSLMGRRALNFECQFRSYEIILEQCRENGIEGEELKIILHRELTDLFLWYRRYVKLPEVKNSIRKKTYAFVQELDVSIFEENKEDYKWYRTYQAICDRAWEKKKPKAKATEQKQVAKQKQPEQKEEKEERNAKNIEHGSIYRFFKKLKDKLI